MKAEVYELPELLNQYDEPTNNLTLLYSGLGEDQVNEIPYPDSWTPGQLFQHIYLYVDGIANEILIETEKINRDPTLALDGLQQTFLDFNTKMKSPDFIDPEDKLYEKQVSIDQLKSAFNLLKENAAHIDMNEEMKDFPVGKVSKLEILHFVVYHTQRHLRQLKKMVDAFDKNKQQ